MNPAIEEAFQAWFKANPYLSNTNLKSFEAGWVAALRYVSEDQSAQHREVEAQKVDELSEELTAIRSAHSGYEDHVEIMSGHPLYDLDDETLASVGEWLDADAERLRAIRLDADRG